MNFKNILKDNQEKLKIYVISCYVFQSNSFISKELISFNEFEEETLYDYFNVLGLMGFNSDDFSAERIKKELVKI